MTPQLPAPGSNRSESEPPRRKRSRPTVDEILDQLEKLNGLVALGIFSPAKASVIQRNLRIMLDAVKQDGGEQPKLATELITELAKANPKLVNQLEPFLTDEQVQWLTEQAGK